jgi:hypothetical protein
MCDDSPRLGLKKCQATSSRSKTMSYKLADQFTQKELLVIEFVANWGLLQIGDPQVTMVV